MNRTIPQLFVDLARERCSRPALRHKTAGAWQDIAWEELSDRFRLFGRGLLALGLNEGDRVAIMAPNGPDWVFADLGCMAAGGFPVALYNTEGITTILHCLKDSGSRFLFLHSPEFGQALASHLTELPALERIILLRGESDHPFFLPVAEFLTRAGEVADGALDARMAAGDPERLVTLIYTSGTTGMPKGAVLSHAAILANVEACSNLFPLGPDDICLSFLPLSHVFERIDGYYFMLSRGVVIAYAESLEAVPANLAEVRPTVMISVPRLYEKMYAKVLEHGQSGPWLRRTLFAAAVGTGREYARREIAGERPGFLLGVRAALARRLVFGRLRQRLGGRLRFFISGGAPLSRDVAEFFLAAGIRIYEGYGLTESAGGIAVNAPQAIRLGTVGRPFRNIQARIADDGEILLQGTGIFRGYWQRPEETAAAFTADGWFRTGDIGALDADGYLSITDRKKDLIITAAGENIAPQFLENRLKGDRLIANALIYGDRKPYLTALLVPNTENLERWARENGITFADHCELVSHPRVLQMLRECLDRLQQDLASFQHIKRFTLLSGDFSKKEITPTLKIRRNLVYARYHDLLESMYEPAGHGVHDRGFCIVEELEPAERG